MANTKPQFADLLYQALETELGGVKVVLPPPEEVKDVSTAIGAARAEQSRDQML